MVKVPFQATAPLSRRAIQARDGKVCQVVGCRRVGQTIDHIVPRSRGGTHEWTNVTLMCVRHNSQKGARLLPELGWTLKSEPAAPGRAGAAGARRAAVAPAPVGAVPPGHLRPRPVRGQPAGLPMDIRGAPPSA